MAAIAPVNSAPSHDAVFQGLRAVACEECVTRKQAGKVLEDFIEEPSVRQFLLLSLVREEGAKTFTWRLNHEALAEAYPSLLLGLTSNTPCERPALFLRGALSDYVESDDLPVIERLFPYFRLSTLAGAGHWLHVEAPKVFNEEVLAFLKGSNAPQP